MKVDITADRYNILPGDVATHIAELVIFTKILMLDRISVDLPTMLSGTLDRKPQWRFMSLRRPDAGIISCRSNYFSYSHVAG